MKRTETTRWDSWRTRQKGGQPGQPRTCLECGKDATPRYMYCCDVHSERSRARIREERASGR